jgi:hypothetical protein
VYVKNCRELVELMVEFLDGLEDTDEDASVDDDPCDDLETEPALGWTESEAGRGRYADPWNVDAELDKSDDEPAMGALEGHTDQSQWGQGSRSDREADGSESGIGDQDGLDEQVPFIDWQNIGMV